MIKVNHPSGVKFTVPDEWVRRGVEITVKEKKKISVLVIANNSYSLYTTRIQSYSTRI